MSITETAFGWIATRKPSGGACLSQHPTRCNRSEPLCFSRYLDRTRNLAERFFKWIKQCRQVATFFTKFVGRPLQSVGSLYGPLAMASELAEHNNMAIHADLWSTRQREPVTDSRVSRPHLPRKSMTGSSLCSPAFVCFSVSIVAIRIFHRAIAAQTPTRWVWIGIAGGAIGYGIWATHFIAMLAYDPGVTTGYGVALTAASLAAAMAITSVGFGLAAHRSRSRAPVGGAIIGAGIVTMHYLGMWALQVPGRVTWSSIWCWCRLRLASCSASSR